MVIEVHTMKKEKIRQNKRDQALWEDFVFKNNIVSEMKA